MAESALTVLYQDLVDAVGYLLFGAREVYPTADLDVIHRAIDSGYSNFLRAGGTYEWRFLRPVASITLVAGVSNYALPDDFGSPLAGFEFAPDSGYSGVEITNQGLVSSLLAISSSQGTPSAAVIKSLPMDGTAGQRYGVDFYPTPDKEYVLTYEYNLIASYRIRAETPYPLGGQLHGETIKEACLAEAENSVEDSADIHTQKYQAFLAQSIAADKRHTPKTLGFRDSYGASKSPYPYRKGADSAILEGID